MAMPDTASATEDHAQIREAQQAYVRDILTRTGWSMRRTAEQAGIASASLSRFLNQKGYSGLLSTATLAKLQRASGIAAPSTITGVAAPAGVEIDTVNVNADPLLTAIAAARPAALLLLQRSDLMAAAGVNPGDILLMDPNQTALPGDIIIADISEDGQRSLVARQFFAPYLVSAPLTSATLTDKASRRPLLIDNERVIVKGVVTDIIRTRKIHST